MAGWGFVCVCVFVQTVSIAIGVPVLSGKQWFMLLPLVSFFFFIYALILSFIQAQQVCVCVCVRGVHACVFVRLWRLRGMDCVSIYIDIYLYIGICCIFLPLSSFILSHFPFICPVCKSGLIKVFILYICEPMLEYGMLRDYIVSTFQTCYAIIHLCCNVLHTRTHTHTCKHQISPSDIRFIYTVTHFHTEI